MLEGFINLRTTAEQRLLVENEAKARNMSLSSFVLECIGNYFGEKRKREFWALFNKIMEVARTMETPDGTGELGADRILSLIRRTEELSNLFGFECIKKNTESAWSFSWDVDVKKKERKLVLSEIAEALKTK